MPEGLHSGKMTHVGAVWEELLPMGWIHGGEVSGVLSPVGGTPHWSRERASGAVGDELTITPIPCSPAWLVGEEVEPNKEGELGESVLKIYHTSHYPVLIL